MDLEAVRTFVAVADTGQFSEAAADLSITQQAVSKRVAGLEKDLGVRLFARTARGARLTVDGQAFLPRARDLLQAAERAYAAVRPGRRGLRVDVVGRGLAPAGLLRGFHRAHPDTELDVVTLFDADAAIAAAASGAIDASFRAVHQPGRLPGSIRASRVFDEPVQLLTGPAHELAGAAEVTPAQLAGQRIWMPGIVPGTEWAAFYAGLAAAFGLSIDSRGPNFGLEPLLETIAGSATAATLGRRADPPQLARRLRPAPHPDPRSGTGLPARADLAAGQPAPRADHAACPPPHDQAHFAERHYLDTGLGLAGGGSWA